MTDKQSKLKAKVFAAISDYLTSQGWQMHDTGPMTFHWQDPKTGMFHRSDFAYVVQSERDIYEREQEQEIGQIGRKHEQVQEIEQFCSEHGVFT
jgi:hypothetical protein